MSAGTEQLNPAAITVSSGTNVAPALSHNVTRRSRPNYSEKRGARRKPRKGEDSTAQGSAPRKFSQCATLALTPGEISPKADLAL